MLIGDQTTTPMMSDSFMINSSSPSILTSVPDHLPNSTRLPGLELDRDQLAGFVAAAGTDGDHFAFARLFLGGVGDDDAAFGLLLGGDAAHDHAVVQRAELGLGHGFLVGASRAGHYRKCCFDKRLALRRESANRCRGDIGSPPTCQAEAAAGCLRHGGLVYGLGGAAVDGALALAVIAPQSRPARSKEPPCLAFVPLCRTS